MQQNIASKNVYIGCGEDRRDNFLHCDLRNLPGVDIVCEAWHLSNHIYQVDQIYSRHMLEHLTSMEAEAALFDWHDALRKGGTLYLVVPNLDYHIQQWLDAEWNESTIKDENSNARYGFAGLYGWQRECNPKLDDYNQSHWDVHKSGYNKKRMQFLLERTGFSNIHVEIKNEVHLVATAEKTMSKGERQISPELKGIRGDHQNRYKFACGILKEKKPNTVLDLACGIGYGAKMLADEIGCPVTAVDIDKGAIDYAHSNYQSELVSYVCADARDVSFFQEFAAIVSFETIEHVAFDRELLRKFYQMLSPGGTFICSTPNQNIMPFDKDKFKFHIKHYTVNEISQLAINCGFRILETYTQIDPKNGDIVLGKNGCFTILVCEKPKQNIMPTNEMK